jgi:linoleoyl-CoA desaturase
MSTIKFSNARNQDFMGSVRSRVMNYFEENGISVYGNYRMVLKTVFMLALYLVPYFLVILAGISNPWINAALWAFMGIGSAGIGLSIMHDANHASYSPNSKVNTWLGYLLNFIGGSAANWKLQHNYLHHAFTNIEGMDEDIDPGPVMRLSPHSRRLRIHRWQHIYGWFLYGLMTISWVLSKDYGQLRRYRDTGILQKQSKSYRTLLTELFISKLLFFGYLLVIPLILSPLVWWQTVLFFMLMHFIQGFILTVIFQPAHVMPTSEYPLPDQTGNMENSWAVHQMHTTSNFSPKSRLFSWYIGGLNYQIEHHLFPNICHIHYRNISGIVKQTALEFGIPYYEQKTFVHALVNHGRMLKRLGRED